MNTAAFTNREERYSTGMGTSSGITRKRPTLRDVADAAGVSRATAGRALSHYGNVNPVLVERVFDAAERLNYRPNAIARSMRQQSTKTVGFVGADIENAFFASVVRGIADTAEAAGFELIITNTDENQAAEKKKIAMLLEKQVDGLLISPSAGASFEHIDELLAIGVPAVLLDRTIPNSHFDAVFVDGEKAGAQAAQHLLDLGHRDVEIIAETTPAVVEEILSMLNAHDHLNAAEYRQSSSRLIGFLRTLQRAGIPIRRENILSGQGYSEENARVAVFKRFSASAPTALFATDYLMTTSALRALRDLGTRIPEDVSFIGFDDQTWSSIMTPPLTVISQPVYEIGKLATEILIRRIHGESFAPVCINPPTELIVRASSRRLLLNTSDVTQSMKS
jgi:LacI family transcriptional regulator